MTLLSSKLAGFETFLLYEEKDISESSSLYQKAFKYFINGELEKALEELDEAKLDDEEKQQAKARVLKADILQIQFRFEQAETNLVKATRIYPSWENHLGLANFYKFLNRFNEAEETYFKSIELSGSSEQKATTLNDLANLHMAKKEFSRAEQSYLEALEIRRNLADANPQSYLPDVGMTLINLAIFYHDSKPDKNISVELLDEAITSLMPFQELPYVQNYLLGAYEVLEGWGFDVEEYLKKWK